MMFPLPKYALIALAFLTLAITRFLSAIEYEIFDLGTIETDQSYACCLNNKGQIVGSYSFKNEKHFFLWDPIKGLSCLDLPRDALPIKINDRGQIIGQLQSHGFFWEEASGILDIGTLGGNWTNVKDINENGQIVGISSNGLENHAFLWEKGEMEDLGALCSELCLHGTSSAALGINNDGLIVGYSNEVIIYKGKKLILPPKAVFWQNGQIQKLKIAGSENYHHSQAITVNDHKQIIYAFEGKSYLRDIHSNEVITLPYKLYSSAHGYLSKPWMKLNCKDPNLIDYQAPKPNTKNTIWKTFNHCADINNSGWIVGSGTTIYGESHAVLLKPINKPEQTQSPTEPIHIPQQEPQIDLKDVIIKYGNNSDGLSVLHYAITKGDKNVVKVLLDHGADVNARDEIYAMNRAIITNQPEIVQILIDRGADIEKPEKNIAGTWSSIHFAAQTGNPEIISILVNHGAPINKNYLPEGDNVKTPLHIAAELGNYEVVQILVKHGAKINSQSTTRNYHFTDGAPLDLAACTLKFSDNPQNLDLIKFLVEQSATRKYSHYNIPCPVIKGYLTSVHR